MTISLQPADATGLHIVANERDIRRDLHTYIAYVRDRRVKRLYRTNELSKADSNRLAKLMDAPELVDAIKETSGALWIDYVDSIAHRLGLVAYDIKGSYRGYSSSEPTFPENYIEFQAAAYDRFLNLSQVEQERRLLSGLVDTYDYSRNEFFSTGILGVLDEFPRFGSGLGVLPTLNFANVRRFLLDVLQNVEPGQWFSTASLVAHLRAHHPYFLIPEKPKFEHVGRQGQTRYGNFRERKSLWDQGEAIPDNAPDGFERVEGRYVERFLEYIPLLLNYVDVAYDPAVFDRVISGSYAYSMEQSDSLPLRPLRNALQAFRVHARLGQALRGGIPAPKVTVQSNFEIYVESGFYPAALINRLAPLTEPIAQGTTTILRLDRQRVAAYHADHGDQNVLALLRQLSERDLPQNVVTELQEWANEADVFTLYEDCGLVESTGDMPPVGKSNVVGIAPGLLLVRNPGDLVRQWRTQGHVVVRVVHPGDHFEALPEGVQTVFPTQTDTATLEPALPQSVTLKRQMLITLFFPDIEVLEAFRKALLEARCPVEMNVERKTLTLAQRYQHELNSAIQALGDTYALDVEEFV